MDLFQKIKGIVEGVFGAISRVDIGRTIDEAVRVYLEKRFKVELFPASASDGSIEFHTRDGRLFATLNSAGAIRVETGGAVYFFTVDEIFKTQESKDRKENSCAPEGREAVIGDDGIFKGVHDYDRQQSIPADDARSVYSEEELRGLIENETLALQNAAKRHAEEAPSASSKKKTSPPRAARTEETLTPRETNQTFHDELTGQTDEYGRVDVASTQERTPAVRLPESAPNRQSPVAVFPPTQTQRPDLPIEQNFADTAPQIQSARVLVAASNDSEDSPRRPEDKNSAQSKAASERAQVDEASAILAGAHALIEDVRAVTAEDVLSISRRGMSCTESENPREAIASPNKDVILYTPAAPTTQQYAPASLRADSHAAMSAEYCATGNSRFDGADSRVGVLGTIVFIEDDPMAIAEAQSDKGGLPPISLLISMIRGGHNENEMRPRLNVEAPHTKRDLGDQRDGKGRDRDESSDEWETLYEGENS